MSGVRSSNYKEEYTRIRIWLLLNLILYVTIECISSLSIVERFEYLAGHLHIVLINYVLLLIITCPCLLFPKMTFVFNLFAVGVLSIACASRVMMIIRGLPLTWPDFFIAKEGLSIAGKYLSPQIVLPLCILAGMGLFLLAKSYSCKFDMYHPKHIILFVMIITSLNLAVVSQAKKDDSLKVQDSTDYAEDGMVYSFVSSYEPRGEIIPDHYTKEEVNALKIQLNEKDVITVSDKNPNIIFLQVESFIDPLSLKHIKYSKDPIPNMRKYMTGDFSGYMESPGINTARTEFEILTGIRIGDLFKFEVPYTSATLDGRPIETIAQVLKRTKGYHATALHNHEGNFYKRNEVYSALGFDHFIPIEYMEGVEYSKNWPKDNVLLPYITKTIDSTPEKDFIFAVTVGTHSSYDYKYESQESDITITGEDVEEGVLNQTQDYIDRLEETDQFVGALIKYVENAKEPTVLIAYGDHIPALDLITFDKDYIKSQVPYFMVSNYKLREKGESILPAYRLYTQVLNIVGIHGGVMSSVHNIFKASNDYYDKMNLLGYDMLMGNQYITDESPKYKVTDLKLGLPQ